MTSKEYIKQIIVKLEDDLQHYTMVDIDKVKAKYIELEIEDYKQVLQDLERLEALEKENKELLIKNNSLNIINTINQENIKNYLKKIVDYKNKCINQIQENEKLKKALDIFKKIVSIPLKDDFAKVKIDKVTKEETLYYALSIKYLIDEQEYELLNE